MLGICGGQRLGIFDQLLVVLLSDYYDVLAGR